MKKILSAFLFSCVYLSVWSWTGSGTPDDPWQLTETMTAVLDDKGTLTFSGSGNMPSCGGGIGAWVMNDDGVLVFVPGGPWSPPKDKVKNVIVNVGITSIGNSMFMHCTNLTSVTIPGSVTRISAGAFAGCYRLESVSIPCRVTNIGAAVFEGCTGLTSIAIPEGVTNIEPRTFWGCSGLTSVTIPKSVTSIGESAFAACTGLTSVLIPDSVTSIEANGFSGCTGLTSVTIPKNVTSIGSGAFSGCSGLKDIYFSGVVPPLIASDAFSSCNADLILHAPRGWTGRTRILGGVYLVVAGEIMGVQQVNMTVTNVVVNYVLNSVQPEFAKPASQDTGFVNIITEVKGGAVSVPSSWADNYPSFTEKFGSDFTKALAKKTGKKDLAGNDMFVWQDYVAGTDPTKIEDKFTASITVVDGKVTVSYTPELDDARKALRKYTTWGKKSLFDTDWTVVQEGHETEYNFFKVSVEMK